MRSPLHARLSLPIILMLGLSSCNSSSPPADTTLPASDQTGNPSGSEQVDSSLEAQLTPLSTLEAAFRDQTSGIQVLVTGTVTRMLSDDVEGDKHQRFIIALSNGQTLLVAHNIDIGARVPDAARNHRVYVYGQYEWNAEGGVVHWTHVDPSGSHAAGWIQFDGTRYQ